MVIKKETDKFIMLLKLKKHSSKVHRLMILMMKIETMIKLMQHIKVILFIAHISQQLLRTMKLLLF